MGAGRWGGLEVRSGECAKGVAVSECAKGRWGGLGEGLELYVGVEGGAADGTAEGGEDGGA